MDMQIKEKFIHLWQRYFMVAELPITFYYTDDLGSLEFRKAPAGHTCVIGELAQVRRGKTLCYQKDSLGCAGGRRYLGFTQELMPNFEYFLSCGIPGKLEGERYKKSPELVKELLEKAPHFTAPGKYLIFKRWDKLEESDNPEVVIFLASADVLSGLFTLANFDQADPNGVIAPFAAGCGTIVQYPYLEKDASGPRAVLGMFDVSARPCVTANVLSFAVPLGKFLTMVENMEESFLITSSWAKVGKRIQKAASGVSGPAD